MIDWVTLVPGLTDAKNIDVNPASTRPNWGISGRRINWKMSNPMEYPHAASVNAMTLDFHGDVAKRADTGENTNVSKYIQFLEDE